MALSSSSLDSAWRPGGNLLGPIQNFKGIGVIHLLQIRFETCILKFTQHLVEECGPKFEG